MLGLFKIKLVASKAGQTDSCHSGTALPSALAVSVGKALLFNPFVCYNTSKFFQIAQYKNHILKEFQ